MGPYGGQVQSAQAIKIFGIITPYALRQWFPNIQQILAELLSNDSFEWKIYMTF